jgi:heme exporter protein D
MLTEFLAMGGYAAFVWPAYGVTALGLSAAVLLTLRGYASAKARLAQFTGETGPP